MMGQVNDCKLAWLTGQGYTGTINGMWDQWLRDQGYTGLTKEMEYAWLGGLGFTGSLNDRWFAFLSDLGAVGHINDRMKQMWCGENGVGPGPIIYLLKATFLRYGPAGPIAVAQNDIFAAADDPAFGSAVAEIDKGALQQYSAQASTLENEIWHASNSQIQARGNVAYTVVAGMILRLDYEYFSLTVSTDMFWNWSNVSPASEMDFNVGQTAMSMIMNTKAQLVSVPRTETVGKHQQEIIRGGYNASWEPDPAGAFGAIYRLDGKIVGTSTQPIVTNNAPWAHWRTSYANNGAGKPIDGIFVYTDKSVLRIPQRALFATFNGAQLAPLPISETNWVQEDVTYTEIPFGGAWTITAGVLTAHPAGGTANDKAAVKYALQNKVGTVLGRAYRIEGNVSAYRAGAGTIVFATVAGPSVNGAGPFVAECNALDYTPGFSDYPGIGRGTLDADIDQFNLYDISIDNYVPETGAQYALTREGTPQLDVDNGRVKFTSRAVQNFMLVEADYPHFSESYYDYTYGTSGSCQMYYITRWQDNRNYWRHMIQMAGAQGFKISEVINGTLFDRFSGTITGWTSPNNDTCRQCVSDDGTDMAQIALWGSGGNDVATYASTAGNTNKGIGPAPFLVLSSGAELYLNWHSIRAAAVRALAPRFSDRTSTPVTVADQSLLVGFESTFDYSAYFIGQITSYSINVTIPGMTFNTVTGVLSGTPTTEATHTGVVVTAIGPSGSASSNTHVIDVAAVLHYSTFSDNVSDIEDYTPEIGNAWENGTITNLVYTTGGQAILNVGSNFRGAYLNVPGASFIDFNADIANQSNWFAFRALKVVKDERPDDCWTIDHSVGSNSRWLRERTAGSPVLRASNTTTAIPTTDLLMEFEDDGTDMIFREPNASMELTYTSTAGAGRAYTWMGAYHYSVKLNWYRVR